MNTSIIQEIGRPDRMNMSEQVYCTDQERNDFWELAGGLPVNARSRGRLGTGISPQLFTIPPSGVRYLNNFRYRLGSHKLTYT